MATSQSRPLRRQQTPTTTFLSPSSRRQRLTTTRMMDKLARAVRLDELKSAAFYRDVAVEFFATFLLLFIVGGLSAQFGDKPSIVQIGLAAGLGVGLIVWGSVSTSGGHINPAISLAVCLAGHITVLRGVAYTVAQCAGAYVAILLTRSLTPADEIGEFYGVTRLNPALTPLQGVVMEVVLTFFLAFTIYAYVDKERPELKPCGPLMIGLAVTMTHMFGVSSPVMFSL